MSSTPPAGHHPFQKRRLLVLLIGWLVACAGGVGLAGLSIAAAPFVGWLILYGGLLGLVQAPVVWKALRVGLHDAGRWVAGSFGGWIGGTLISVWFTEGPAGDVSLALPWLGFGAGQLPVLARAIRRRHTRTRGIATLWVLASTVAGGLATNVTIWTGTTALYMNVEGALGGLGAGVVQQILVITAVYGLPTGGALLWAAHVVAPRRRAN